MTGGAAVSVQIAREEGKESGTMEEKGRGEKLNLLTGEGTEHLKVELLSLKTFSLLLLCCFLY